MSRKTLPASLAGLRIGLFPYGVTGNPYQKMIAEALAGAGFSPLPLPKRNWFALRQVAREPIDVLQLHWPHSLYHGRNALAAQLKRWMFLDGLRCLRRLPVMYSADNLLPHDVADENFEKMMIQHLVDRLDGVIAATAAAAQIFRSTYHLPAGVEIATVPHRHYLAVYPNEISQAEARARLRLPPGGRVLLFLGRLCWYKGLERLVPAFLAVDAPATTLLLAGQPETTELVHQLERQIAAHRRPQSGVVRVDAHFIPDAEIQLYMNAADAVVLPYADLPMNPGSLVLTMGFGKAVISPAKGSTPEIAGESLIGYDEHDPAGLTLALQRALTADDLVARGQEALERVRRNHSPAQVSAAYHLAYEQLAARLRN